MNLKMVVDVKLFADKMLFCDPEDVNNYKTHETLKTNAFPKMVADLK